MNQIQVHKEIDNIIKSGINNADFERLNTLIGLNYDAKKYFYSEINKDWLEILYTRGFLDLIKRKSEDPSRYSYSMPELDYLIKISDKIPGQVVDIILDTPISTDNFNPEVIDQYIRICSELPCKELVRVIEKIKNDKWIVLMKGFNSWGGYYRKMLETLSEKGEYNALIELSESVLAVRPKKDFKDTNVFAENPFYFNDLAYLKVFRLLSLVGNDYIEPAYKLSLSVLSNVILLGGNNKRPDPFEFTDSFSLYDVDFFTIKVGSNEGHSFGGEVRELAALVKVLSERIIEEKRSNKNKVLEIFNTYIKPLPDTSVMWRLRLFILSLCPEAFNEEVKMALFRMFQEDNFYSLTMGTEYELSLKKCFHILSNDEQSSFVDSIVELCSEPNDKKDDEYLKIFGSNILSMIAEYIPKDKRSAIKNLGFNFNKEYEPSPSFSSGGFTGISPKGVVEDDEFKQLSINELINKLKTDWSPEQLNKKKDSNEDSTRPRNPSGVTDQIKNNIPERLNEYIESSPEFFDRDNLDAHYTYGYLQGLHDFMRNNSLKELNLNWNKLIELIVKIKNSGESIPFEDNQDKKLFSGWLSNWNNVLLLLPDIINILLNDNKVGDKFDFNSNRENLLSIITYLLKFSDPTPSDENPETARFKTKDPNTNEYVVTDPFTMALNSVRGRAFQSLTFFVYRDGKKFPNDSSIKISDDVKDLYEVVLDDEGTRTVMFMFGYYLPSFYYRDRDWIYRLLPKIFPQNEAKKPCYTAAWEGYLSTSLYKEIFSEAKMQELYKKGLNLNSQLIDWQKNFKDLEEGIATHLALAFIYYDDFDFDHSLFKALWDGSTSFKIKAKFINFIGRSFISGDNRESNELIDKNKRSKDKLLELWDWVLENSNERDVFTEFGFWINLKKKIFSAEWLAERARKTLEKTDGCLKWEIGLMDSVVEISKMSPEEGLSIIKLYLLDGCLISKNNRHLIHITEEWQEALEIIYANELTKQGAYDLIASLIEKGDKPFWPLKEIIKD